ncbi:hypothetical protein Tco_0082689 [Tanacetum coccineum]
MEGFRIAKVAWCLMRWVSGESDRISPQGCKELLQPKEEQQPVSDSKSPMTNHIALIKTDTTTQASTASCSDSPSQFMSPCNSTSSADQSSSMTPSIVSSSDADMVVRTKATFTVGKTLSSNIMDGLLRRWDLNFFNNR